NRQRLKAGESGKFTPHVGCKKITHGCLARRQIVSPEQKSPAGNAAHVQDHEILVDGGVTSSPAAAPVFRR
ncbi:MAG: hypothetical protein KGJ00_23635, partial [Bradyrhizobium sp.]|nr:hypothetical protein [Bradyrhizobium sp.]